MSEESILLATSNAGKVRELAELLAELPFRVFSLGSFVDVTEVAETGATFEENAILKAQGYSSLSRSWTLADDSGLEVEALGNSPGVHSARYVSRDASYTERMTHLLEELKDKAPGLRRARFACVVALYHPRLTDVKTFRGECRGTIALSPRGEEGFGYDPIFIPDGYDQTFGELSPLTKQSISHRARAAISAREFLQSFVPVDVTRP